MAFIPKTWVDDQIVYAEDMNRIEQGIADAVSVTPQTLTDAQKTQARANIAAAPAGYGLGTSCVPIGTQSLDTITNNGWYQFGEDNTTAPVYAGELFVMKRTSDGYCAQVISYAGSYFPCFLVRRQTEGTWSDWEWVNPPMQVSVEYRTTERFLGQPVYVKAIDFGALPNATTKSVSHSASNVDVCIRATGSITSGDKRSIPFADSNGRVDICGDSGLVTIKTDYNYSSLSAYATIWYTKTTD